MTTYSYLFVRIKQNENCMNEWGEDESSLKGYGLFYINPSAKVQRRLREDLKFWTLYVICRTCKLFDAPMAAPPSSLWPIGLICCGPAGSSNPHTPTFFSTESTICVWPPLSEQKTIVTGSPRVARKLNQRRRPAAERTVPKKVWCFRETE